MLKFKASGWIGLTIWLSANVLAAPAATIPENWLSDSPESQFKVDYADLDAVLKASVLMSGPPSRKKAASVNASIGTRLKNNYNVLTANAGNRFAYEEFRDNLKMQQLVSAIRQSLAQLPAELPLQALTKQEQLAYWLNLYNVTVLDELIKIYPVKKLEDVVTGPDSLLTRPLLNVDGVALSLNDIQFQIVLKMYPDTPEVLYGFYQGYIGSPSIRKHAYTGDNVMRTLAMNANDFINSNRGTYMYSEDDFRIAEFYQRNRAFFSDFRPELSKHLRKYLKSAEADALMRTTELVADINDWTITNLYGTSRNYGGASASNPAALQDMVVRSNASTDTAAYSGIALDKAVVYQRFSAQQMVLLKQLKEQHQNRGGLVTVKDLPVTEPTENTTENQP